MHLFIWKSFVLDTNFWHRRTWAHIWIWEFQVISKLCSRTQSWTFRPMDAIKWNCETKMFHMVPVRFFLLNSSFELRWKPVSLCLQHQSWQRSRAWPDTCSERTEPFSDWLFSPYKYEEEKRPRTHNNRVGPLKPQITDTSSTTSPVVTAEAHIRDPEGLKPI